jgi:hypothetical protein
MLHFATSFWVFDHLNPCHKSQGSKRLGIDNPNVFKCLSPGIEANASKREHR